MSNQNIERFESLMARVKRRGVDELMNYIRTSDFYTAPASTRYHSCHEGGLLEHSLNVYDCLCVKANSSVWKDVLPSEESVIVAALLHDICKTNYYVTEFRNKKIYSDSGKRMDTNGRYDWLSVPGYTVDDKIPLGHGEKSVMMIEEFMRLKPIERYGVRWHMGFSEPKESWGTLGAAIRKYPFILALHEADLESTYLIEKEE